ncbi:MAG: tetratricopeptide repeat protein, partial [Chloroflexi bacterium]|nr:tetratricopeptide repeat protein [Chloroflexota bacterium]
RFVMTEDIRLLSERGELTAEHIGTPDGLRIPEGVREVIGQRLNRLSEQCNEVLTTASIIGREFDFRLLNVLCGGMSEDQLLQAVDEAVSGHLIEDVPGQIERYQFNHALIQQTLAEELTTSRRVRLHARIAETLEELYGANAEAHAPELAYHFAEAESVKGTEKLVHYSLLAGDRALATYAYEDALTHFEKGLVAREITLSGTEVASDEEAAALLFGLARAQSATVEAHRLGEAFATLSRAFEYFAEVENVALAVAAAEFPMAPPAYLIPGVSQLLARALTLVPADSHEAGRLLSRYGGILGIAECDYEGARQALGRAIAIAKREGDVPLEVQTLTYAAIVSGQHLRWQESVDNGLRAIELATGDENTLSEVLSRWWSAVSLLRMGDLDAARPHALAMRDLVERRSSRLLASIGFVPVTSLPCLEGHWNVGREYSDRGLDLSPLNPQLLGARVTLEHETGESAQGEVFLERLLEVMRRAGPDQFFASGMTSAAIPAIARITGVPDHLEIAEAAAEAVLSAQSVTPFFAMYAKTGLALLAVQKGDQSAAAEHYGYLQWHRGTMIATVSSVDRLLGLLSQTMGNLDQAMAHFEEALAFCRKAGYRPELAWTCCDYTDTLIQQDNLGNHDKAMSLLDESLAMSTELGMHPLMERVLARQENLKR